MKERPITLCGYLVHALLSETKTQARWPIKVPPFVASEDGDWDYTRIAWLADHESGPGWYGWMTEYPEEGSIPIPCPFAAGDRLWVREQWQAWTEFDKTPPSQIPTSSGINFTADGNVWDARLRSAAHMPRWASRLSLDIVSVRAERLHPLSEKDARAEGAKARLGLTAKEVLHLLWDSIHGTGSWEQNPWVWVLALQYGN